MILNNTTSPMINHVRLVHPEIKVDPPTKKLSNEYNGPKIDAMLNLKGSSCSSTR